MPSLCKKHSAQVGNYFDARVARTYELDPSTCVICHQVIRVEEARRYLDSAMNTDSSDSNGAGESKR